jgi:hypothetical protein
VSVVRLREFHGASERLLRLIEAEPQQECSNLAVTRDLIDPSSRVSVFMSECAARTRAQALTREFGSIMWRQPCAEVVDQWIRA